MRTSTYRLICLCTLANFINSADRVIMPITIIQMANEFGWSISWQGWILSSFAFGYITSQIIGTTVASKIGPGTILTISVFFWSFSTLITPFIASHLYLLILCRIILGFGEGLGLPMIFQLFSSNVPISERSRAFAYLISAGTVGQTVAALITPHFYWPWMFFAFGTLGIVWSLVWFRFYHYKFRQFDESLRKVSDLVSTTTTTKTTTVISGEDDIEAPFIQQSNLSSKFSCSKSSILLRPKYKDWTKFVNNWPLWSIYIAHFAMNWSNYIIMQWLPYYLSRYLGADEKSLSLTALPYIMNSIAGIGAGHLADNLITERKWSILWVRRLMTAVGLFGAGLSMLLFCSVHSLMMAIVIICLAMSFCACNAAGHLSNHTDVAPNHAGITFAISNTLATIPGLLCGPLTAELVTQSSGRWLPVFSLAAAINFVGAIIYCNQSSANQVI